MRRHYGQIMNSRVFAGIIAALCIAGVGLATLTRGSDDPTPVVAAGATDNGDTDRDNTDSTASDSTASNSTASNSEKSAAPVSDLPEPENFGSADTLVELDGWLQTDATSLEDFDGQVKILQFWTFSCHNCTATIPTLQHLYETYQADGLEIIGVHAPEFSFEEDPVAVQEAANDLGVTWPIAIDNKKRNFRSWQGSRRFWPRTYVIDANGDIRFDHIGEGAYDELEETVAYLLQNGGA